ncbi:TIGR02444 family protein [Agrobacterium vitis]|uniref:TIGR02444 family protein n=1 Tax=Agrobacterium vitis TaxID=373 RepID=A0A368NN77_AGRVI|nr:TIGR02444 family protein [Agrobacterium vitis]KAA3505450.1 TIGR02444 family protein [Agrobacterium vitis]KAA3519346.1 TIGR02444 family protein [Agrobacterium vitis]MCF1480325.1 TIGR02444 family protein [Agrobacterium vitis]MUZ76005.1 TIGR02444 family protein [Agrobacterium vitis]MUZ99872.1 TIGR02444 family protein [Agrobacterium vitis]
METADHFANNAWTAMCALYRTPEVAQLCVHLQDAYGIDVPLLLLLFHADQQKIGLDINDLNAFLTDATSWREDVVKPLRTIRQGMRGRYTEHDEVQLRTAVKALELQAEQVHVSRLARSFMPHAKPTERTQMCDGYLLDCCVPEGERIEALRVFQSAVDGAHIQDNDEERRLL